MSVIVSAPYAAALPNIDIVDAQFTNAIIDTIHIKNNNNRINGEMTLESTTHVIVSPINAKLTHLCWLIIEWYSG